MSSVMYRYVGLPIVVLVTIGLLVIVTGDRPIHSMEDSINDDDDTAGKEHNCRVADFNVQQKFQLEQCMGTWYEIAKKTQDEYQVPDSTTTTLIQIDNNTVSMTIDLFRMNNQCIDMSVNGIARVDGAQWTVTFDPIGDEESKRSYWIVDTDYDNYALVYGCNMNNDGACLPHENNVYVMGRQAVLSQVYMDRINELLPLLCIEPDEIIVTRTDDCRSQSTGLPRQPEPRNCYVDQFHVKDNFEKSKLNGQWFEVARLKGNYPHMCTMMFLTERDEADDEHFKRVMRGIQLPDVCLNRCIVLNGYASESNPAKLIISMSRLQTGHLPLADEVDYWILSTDYIHYAVTYSCQERNKDGSCKHGSERLWILSRSLDLDEKYMELAVHVASSLCITISSIASNRGTWKEIKNKVTGSNKVFARVPQSLPSLHKIPRRCNPKREVYGCCTLIDAPAVGPNDEGCPGLPTIEPLVESKTSKCWTELQLATEEGVMTTITCDEDGAYTEVQCDASLGVCWCVNQETGKDIPGSSVDIMDQLDCTLTLCQRHQKRIDGYLSHQNVKSKYFYRPNCDMNGNYAAAQCFESWKYCWCVNIETGKKRPGTLVQGTMPMCDYLMSANSL